MAIVCDIIFDKEKLSQKCAQPTRESLPTPMETFVSGPEYAARQLGYEYMALQALPRSAAASFAGVGDPSQMCALPSGATARATFSACKG
jgi:hypothetical protein